MKKIFIIDGSPRKTMNTAKMVEAFKNGANSAGEGLEVKHIRLYDYNFKDCYECMACKIKGSKFHDFCGRKDGISEVLKEVAYADGIVFASPVYYGDANAMLRAFYVRLTFPWLSYQDGTTNPPKKNIPSALIFTMNATKDQQIYVKDMYSRWENMMAMFFKKPELIIAMNTTQVKNYDRYDMGAFSTEEKKAWQDEHFAEEQQNAFDAGEKMAMDILGK